MVDFNQLLGGPLPQFDTDPDMSLAFRKYARKNYKGQLKSATVYRDKSVHILVANGPDIVIPDLVEFENVLRQLLNSARDMWSDDPAWKLYR